jgi:hypothetical protein
MKIILAILLSVTLFGCESLKFKNLAKTGATTAVTYAVAGGIPAISVLATSITVDEVLPKTNQVDDIKSKEQAVAFVADSFIVNALYAFIAFLLITNVLTPFISRKWGYNQAKAKYKGDKNEN